jgi:biotin operon repressor
MSLLKTYRDRPHWVPDPDGQGRDCISVHDTEHLRRRSDWKRQLAEAHPDAGGSSFRFHRLVRDRKRWELAEQAWYVRRGLSLPEPPREAAPRVTHRRKRTWHTRVSGADRLLALLSDGEPHVLGECRAVVGGTRHATAAAAKRLRAEGYDIASIRRSDGYVYQWIR